MRPSTCASAVPPGASAGVPAEIVNVNPLTRNSVPSVVTKDGTRSVTVTSPFSRPTEAAAEHAQHHRQWCRHARLRCEMHDERRHGEDHAGGQVDLAHDHQHDLATGDDRRRCDILRQVLQAGAAQQEIPVRQLEIDDQQQRNDEDARLLPLQEPFPQAIQRCDGHAISR